MNKEFERMKPTGTTVIERWYALARKHVAIIAWRQKRMPRCKRCFVMWLRRGDLQTVPRFGCGGCAEMETFMQECRAFFADDGKGARHDR